MFPASANGRHYRLVDCAKPSCLALLDNVMPLLFGVLMIDILTRLRGDAGQLTIAALIQVGCDVLVLHGYLHALASCLSTRHMDNIAHRLLVNWSTE